MIDILSLIKEKRNNAYNDYMGKQEKLYKIKKDTKEYEELKDNLKSLAITINTYDDLIINIENLNSKRGQEQ